MKDKQDKQDKQAHMKKMLAAQEEAARKKVGEIAAKMADYVPTLEQVEVFSKVERLDLVDIVDEYLALAEQKKEIEARQGQLRDVGLRYLVKAGFKSIAVAGATVTRIDGSSSSLNKQKLVTAHGLEVLQWVEEAMDHKQFTSLKITPKKEKKEVK